MTEEKIYALWSYYYHATKSVGKPLDYIAWCNLTGL